MKKFTPFFLILGLVLFHGCGGESTGPDNGNEPDHVSIVQIDPVHGTVGLEDTAQVRIEFDRAVASVGAILVPGLKWMDEDWLFRSADSTTFYRTIVVQPEKVYQMIVFGALGADGSYLDEAQMTVFTTTGELPTGSITGKATAPASHSPKGTVILLVDAKSWVPSYGFSEENSLEDNIVAFGFVSESSGDFAIDNLPSGQYYLYAFKDATSDGVVEDENDLFGVYGEWGAFGLTLMNITVRNGQETEDIDFLLLKGQSFF